MSLFGSLMGDFDDDMFLGNPMNAMNMQMRNMNRMMNSLMPDPFNMLTPFDHGGFQQNAMMERGNPAGHMGMGMGGMMFPAFPNINRLLNADIGNPNGASYCSSSVISMSSGPDGRPQIYQATTSSKSGPGGVRETRKTVQDSTTGVKKMAIGHHIGERSHIIEKEQDLRSGQLEERQEFINLDEEQAEDFDREFTNRAYRGAGIRPQQQMLTIEPADSDEEDDEPVRQHKKHDQPRRQLPALPAPPQQNNSSTMSSQTANANATNGVPDCGTNYYANNSNNNNVHNYLSTTPRRAHHRGHLVAGNGATARRPLRTPTSSPLTTTPPTNHIHNTATSPREWRLYNPRFYRK